MYGLEIALMNQYRGKYIEREGGPVIPLSEIVITSKCFGNCNYCGSDIKANGKDMSLDLFLAILESPQTTFDLPLTEYVGLGEGEVLQYKDLVKVIRAMVEREIKVTISTKGIIPINEKVGREILRGLQQLKGYAEKITVQLSFTLLQDIPKEVYLRSMRETMELLEWLGEGVMIYVLQHRETPGEILFENPGETMFEFEELNRSFGFKYREETLDPVGRAVRNHRFNAQEFESGNCDVANMGNRVFSIRPEGNISLYCGGFGSKNTVLGNVYDHNAMQMYRAYERFLREHRGRCRRKLSGIHICENHRRWRKNFSPRHKTRNPIIKACR